MELGFYIMGLRRPFNVIFLLSKTKMEAIICVVPQGGHLRRSNYVVVLRGNLVFLYETVLPSITFSFTWALKPFNYYHLIIITV